MNLKPYAENIQRQLALAGEAGGDEARLLAERLLAPLDAAVRLTLLEVLVAAAEEITCDLAPGSVEVRLRGSEPEFVVTPPPVEVATGERSGSEAEGSSNARPGAAPTQPVGPGQRLGIDADEGAMSRINLRMPDHLKARIERAAAAEGLSVNAWLVRAAAGELGRADGDPRPERRTPQGPQRYTGWGR
jgi:hypothetical protein